MEKTIEFKIPEGYIFDKDNSTENIIRFKPIEKKLTYANIIKDLYSRGCYYINNNPTSTKQLQQLLALNKLMNVAKYLNGDWEPDWNNSSETKWGISFNGNQKKIDISVWGTQKYGNVYFKLEELVYQAIEILGEEEVKKALGIFE
jgi:hypothetical protein